MVQDLDQDQNTRDLILILDCGDQDQMVQITEDSDPKHQQDKTTKDHREKDLELEVMVKSL